MQVHKQRLGVLGRRAKEFQYFEDVLQYRRILLNQHAATREDCQPAGCIRFLREQRDVTRCKCLHTYCILWSLVSFLHARVVGRAFCRYGQEISRAAMKKHNFKPNGIEACSYPEINISTLDPSSLRSIGSRGIYVRSS